MDKYAFNQVLLAKQCWRIIKCPDSLVARVIKARYFLDSNFFEASIGWNSSFLWCSLLGGREVIEKGSRWRAMGNP